MVARREFLLFLAGLMALPAGTAFAKDGDDDNSGSGGGGGDDDDHSGSGGGGGDDDDDHGGGGGGGDDDDSGGDDNGDDDEDNGGSGGGGKGKEARKARDAVKSGKVIPLREVLKLVRNKYPGRVIKVDVSEKGNNLIYSIKLIDDRNRRMQIRVNANQRRIIGAKFI
jgi:uncharacterized membrane protein YkoI